MDLGLHDRVYLVTGGAGGLGLASARALVAEGARVVLSGRTAASLEAAAAELGDAALTVVADKGFDNGEHASACERDGIVACVPSQRSINNQGDGTLFDRTAFAYETFWSEVWGRPHWS